MGRRTGVLTLRNVTAIATGAGSYGILANSTSNDTNLDVSARNVIASGVLADIGSGETGTNSESDVILSYSNYDKIEELGGGNASNVGSVSTNQTALPIFLDATLYHQAQNSPTVDKGTTDNVGTADLDGQPRQLGAAPDIGADEYDTIAPDVAFVHVPKQKSRKHKVTFTFIATEAVTFTCKVDKKKAKPCNSPFKVKIKRYGKHKITVTARDVVGNVDPTPATYSWKLKHKHKKKQPPPPLIHRGTGRPWRPSPQDPCRGGGPRAAAGDLGRAGRPGADGAVHAVPQRASPRTVTTGAGSCPGSNVLGAKVAPAFTERMVFREPHRIEFHHDPPAGTTEQAGVAGWYALTARLTTGPTLVTELEITLDLPLPEGVGTGRARGDAQGHRHAWATGSPRTCWSTSGVEQRSV